MLSEWRDQDLDQAVRAVDHGHRLVVSQRFEQAARVILQRGDATGRLAVMLHDAPEYVIGESIEPVGGDPGRLVRQVVAALVGRHDPETGGGERRDLMPPAVPELRKPVQ